MKPTKEYKGRSHIRMYRGDCIDLLKSKPENYWQLAIVDPPYRDKNQPTKEMRDKVNGRMKEFGARPNTDYFNALFIVSENQIIWGGNNFIEQLYSTNAFIFWYKRNPMKNYSDGELAWTSFNTVARCLPLDHFGAHTSDKIKHHPTQKPVALYKWILQNYAKEGDKILDTHGGSMSIAIACWDLGFDLDIIELDKEYFDTSVKRFENHIDQLQLEL